MKRDTFIIMVYCLVVEQMSILLKSYSIRNGAFASAFCDEEVVTIEICACAAALKPSSYNCRSVSR